jgi:polyisoprenoid-binding protein YceI
MTKALIGLPLAVIAIVAAGVAVWWFAIRSDASALDDPLPIPSSLLNTASPTAASSTEPTSATTGQAWTIVDGQSEADYYVGETLASLGVPSTANGKTQDITGTFYLTADGTALDTSQTSSFTVDLTTLASDKERRDTRVQQALETGTYPTATFVAESVDGVPSAIEDGRTYEFTMTGTLTLHGVIRTVTWNVEATREQNVISAIATLDFSFADYDITPPNIGGFVSVEDHGTLQAVIIAQQG